MPEQVDSLHDTALKLVNENRKLLRENALLKSQITTLNEIIRRIDKELHPDD